LNRELGSLQVVFCFTSAMPFLAISKTFKFIFFSLLLQVTNYQCINVWSHYAYFLNSHYNINFKRTCKSNMLNPITKKKRIRSHMYDTFLG
jgi:hypothetical protein